MSVRGRFLTLEGVDGAGKSSHIAAIRETLAAAGVPALFTREPGGTPLGERLRTLLLEQPMTLSTETLLIFAARAEHLEQLIRPALARGQWVVSDRFTDATYAYQGCGRVAGAERVRTLEQWVQGGFQPDLTLLFDLPVETAIARRQQASATLDRFEALDRGFFERVRAGYQDRVRHASGRIRVVDASAPLEAVSAQVRKIIGDYIQSVQS
jgi:dTMP kinase